jgi:glucan biosynthesis protein C
VTNNTHQRLHGIDALRAITMILGLLLHATIAYKVEPIPNWPSDKTFQHWTFDGLYMLLHSFRMPLFFLVAGFFCRLLYYKIGEAAFIRHRFKRIVLPFIFSIILILPITIFPFSVYRYMSETPGQWDLIFYNSFKQLFHWNGLAHLWFLYYLTIYYIIFVFFLRLRRLQIFKGLSDSIFKVIDKFKPGSFTGIFIVALSVWLVLICVPEGYLHVDTGIFPQPPYLFFYIIFFSIGWLINRNPISFGWMTENFLPLLLQGSILGVVIFWVSFFKQDEMSPYILFFKGLIALQIVSLVFGVIGLFLRYFKSENHFWKYVSDATYWMYLVHLSIVASLQDLFIYLGTAPFLRFPLVLFISLLASFVSYHFWIRYSIVGTYLHGERKKPQSSKANIKTFFLLERKANM